MIVESFVQALQSFTEPSFLIPVLIGTFVGFMFGIVPGISALMGMAIVLPFLFMAPPAQALAFMVAMSGVGYTGGAITAILINIPGDANQATLMDGFPMSQKGQAGRAIGAALASSGLGGAATVFIALAMIPVVLAIVYAITSADMVFIILLGISFISVLGKGSMLKGLISGGLGLLISLIGLHVITGVPRFTFGSTFLFDGLPLIPVTLGLWALPEMIDLAASGGTIAKMQVPLKGMQQTMEGIKDVFRHWAVWLRSSVIGFIVGVIPGIGASTSMFVAYGQAKHTSRYPEKFGTGIVDGVIASEASNNATQGGALLTTLALGIPGSASTAILIGAFLMLGLIPGPTILKDHLPLSLSLFLVVIFSNLVAAGLALPAVPYLAKVCFVPGRILVPLVVVLVFAGCFISRQDFADLIVVLVITAVGLAIKRYGFNAPALFLGYVMGILFEKYFFLALSSQGPLFWVRPISLTLIAITIASLCYEPLRRLIQRRREAKA